VASTRNHYCLTGIKKYIAKFKNTCSERFVLHLEKRRALELN